MAKAKGIMRYCMSLILLIFIMPIQGMKLILQKKETIWNEETVAQAKENIRSLKSTKQALRWWTKQVQHEYSWLGKKGDNSATTSVHENWTRRYCFPEEDANKYVREDVFYAWVEKYKELLAAEAKKTQQVDKVLDRPIEVSDMVLLAFLCGDIYSAYSF
jgi:hypothetical protein